MSAKRAATALLELDTNLVAFASGLDSYDPEKSEKVAAFVRESVMDMAAPWQNNCSAFDRTQERRIAGA